MVIFDPYMLLSDGELETAIRDLSFALTTGASQISSPDAGTVGYQSRRDAMATMRSMQRAYLRRKGLKLETGDRPVYREVIVRKTGE